MRISVPRCIYGAAHFPELDLGRFWVGIRLTGILTAQNCMLAKEDSQPSMVVWLESKSKVKMALIRMSLRALLAHTFALMPCSLAVVSGYQITNLSRDVGQLSFVVVSFGLSAPNSFHSIPLHLPSPATWREQASNH